MATDLRLQFGEFALDQRNACVWRGSETLKLKPKAFDVLRYLVEHAGELVSKDELWRAIWPDVAVTDGVLAVCLTEIRQALGDDAKAPRFIETMHRRGYRFISPVAAGAAPVPGVEFQVPSQEEASHQANGEDSRPSSVQRPELNSQGLEASVQSLELTTPSPPPEDVQTLDPRLSDSRMQRSWSVRSLLVMGLWLLVSIILAVQYVSLRTSSTQPPTPNPQPLPLPDKPSLIVLPLVNLSGDPEQEYFSDGLTEVLTGDLSRISSLFVIARNSAFTYKGKAAKVQDVSREMGVRYVLEGSVQRAEKRIRIAVQLIDATTGYHLWSEQYDRPLTDIFALQDEIMQKIATTLKLQLTLEEQGYILRKHTTNVEAYDHFLRGIEPFYRLTPEANLQARQQWEKAIALDPQYAEAYEWLSVTYLYAWLFHWSADPQTLERASVYAHQAIALDDSLPTAHWGLSHVYVAKQQYDQAIAEADRAITLDPNNATSYYVKAEALNYAGRPEEAILMMEQSIRLNPHPPYVYILGWAYNLAGRYAEAIAVEKEAISRNPNSFLDYLQLAQAYLGQWWAQQSPPTQTLAPALAAIQQAVALNDSFFWNHLILGLIYLNQQQYDEALAEMKRTVTLAPTEAFSYLGLAMVLSYIGRTEEALQAVVQALRFPSSAPVDSHFFTVGVVYAIAGQYEEAGAALQRFLSHYPNLLPAHVALAAVYSELGQTAEAQKEAGEVLRLNPNFSLAVHRQRMPIKDPAVLERHIAALRKAGLK